VLLITEGDQDPVTPVGDVVANNGAVSPEQNGGIGLKFGLSLNSNRNSSRSSVVLVLD
jgi:hypothetical protein